MHRRSIATTLLAGWCAACPSPDPGSETTAASSSSSTGTTGTGGPTTTGGTAPTTTAEPTTTGTSTTTGEPGTTTGPIDPSDTAGTSGSTTTTDGTTGTGTTTGGDDCPDLAPRGMWVWQSSAAEDPDQTAALFEFAAAHQVTRVFLESQTLLTEEPELLALFIDAAAAECLATELLFGNADWTLPENHDVPLALVDAAVAFAAALPGARPFGLHFDIEPHGLDTWADQENALANDYLDLLEVMTPKLAGQDLPLTVDIAFWYDGVDVTRDGKVRPFSELIVDRVDRITVMDYRDHAEPPDGIIDNAESEFLYTAQVGKHALVGVETKCGLDPEKVTFCEEGNAALEQALAATAVAYDGSSAWAGVAVHDHKAWNILPP